MSSSSSSESTSSASSPSPSPPPSIRKRKRTTSTSAENQEEPAVTLLDEPTPLSHAEKRRQKKGKSLKSPNPKDDGADAPVAAKRVDEDSAADAAAKAKRQNSVWVGNLSFKTTADSLKAFLSGAGEITRVMMPMKPATAPGAGKWKDAAPVKAAENKGFAYVDFATPEGQATAIAKSEGHLDGRRLLIKAGNDFAGRPTPAAMEPSESTPAAWRTKFAKKVLSVQKQVAAPTLFLGNLGFETTEASIRGMLDAHRRQSRKGKGKETADADDQDAPSEGIIDGAEGKLDKVEKVEKMDKAGEVWIRQVRLGTFEDSGKCKGWAFVDFTTKEHATDALVNPHNHKLDGRDIKVEFASSEAVRRGSIRPGPRVHKLRDPNADPKAKYGKRRLADGEVKEGGGDAPFNKALAVGDEEEEKPAKRPRKDEDQPVHQKDARTAHSREERSVGRPARGGTVKGKGLRDRVRPRPTPGAALALAKRESTAIVPSEGKKIKF